VNACTCTRISEKRAVCGRGVRNERHSITGSSAGGSPVLVLPGVVGAMAAVESGTSGPWVGRESESSSLVRGAW
jgi:hypothetical protein